MSSKSKKPFKPIGGSCSIVRSIKYFSKMKQYGKINVSFNRYSKSSEFLKKCILMCRRIDYMNPSLTSMCYKYFSKDVYARELKVKLFGYTPSVQR